MANLTEVQSAALARFATEEDHRDLKEIHVIDPKTSVDPKSGRSSVGFINDLITAGKWVIAWKIDERVAIAWSDREGKWFPVAGRKTAAAPRSKAVATPLTVGLDAQVGPVGVTIEVNPKPGDAKTGKKKKVVVLLDCSGSMGTVERLETRLETCKRCVKILTDQLGNVTVYPFNGYLQPAVAGRDVDRLVAGGGTNFVGAFTSLLPNYEGEGEKTLLCFISDGQAWDLPDGVLIGRMRETFDIRGIAISSEAQLAVFDALMSKESYCHITSMEGLQNQMAGIFGDLELSATEPYKIEIMTDSSAPLVVSTGYVGMPAEFTVSVILLEVKGDETG
jgi:hypothetical protein